MASERDEMTLAAANPMRRVLMMVLIFEAVVCGLAVPGMILVSAVSPTVAGVAAGSTAVVMLVAAATLRTPVGYWLGWVSQLAALALGLLTPMMFVAGGLFVIIWVSSFILGKRLDADSPADPASPRRHTG